MEMIIEEVLRLQEQVKAIEKELKVLKSDITEYMIENDIDHIKTKKGIDCKLSIPIETVIDLQGLLELASHSEIVEKQLVKPLVTNCKKHFGSVLDEISTNDIGKPRLTIK